jgi:hypothetical protein
MSSALQRDGVQLKSEFVMLSRPVVHWQAVSVRLQPEPCTAGMKQGICCRYQSHGDEGQVGRHVQRSWGHR